MTLESIRMPFKQWWRDRNFWREVVLGVSPQGERYGKVYNLIFSGKHHCDMLTTQLNRANGKVCKSIYSQIWIKIVILSHILISYRLWLLDMGSSQYGKSSKKNISPLLFKDLKILKLNDSIKPENSLITGHFQHISIHILNEVHKWEPKIPNNNIYNL